MPKKGSLEHPECCIRCTSACGRFRVRLHFTSRDDCLQTLCTLDTGRRLPLVAICTAWRADQVLYGSCTISIYNDDTVLSIFTQDYHSWRRSETRGIPRSTVDLSSSVRCSKCFSDRNPQIRLRFDKKKDSKKPKTARTTCKVCICPAVCNIQFI